MPTHLLLWPSSSLCSIGLHKIGCAGFPSLRLLPGLTHCALVCERRGLADLGRRHRLANPLRGLILGSAGGEETSFNRDDAEHRLALAGDAHHAFSCHELDSADVVTTELAIDFGDGFHDVPFEVEKNEVRCTLHLS